MIHYNTSSPMISLYYNPELVDIIKGFSQLDANSVLKEINSKSKDCDYYPDNTWCGYILTFDWSTGLEFDNHYGGGYVLSIEGDWSPESIAINCYVEWNDSWVVDNSLSGQCNDFDSMIIMAVKDINKLIESL